MLLKWKTLGGIWGDEPIAFIEKREPCEMPGPFLRVGRNHCRLSFDLWMGVQEHGAHNQMVICSRGTNEEILERAQALADALNPEPEEESKEEAKPEPPAEPPREPIPKTWGYYKANPDALKDEVVEALTDIMGDAALKEKLRKNPFSRMEKKG